MRRRAGTKRGHANLAGTCFGERNQFGDGLDWERWIYIQCERKTCKTRYRCKIAQQVERKRLKESRIDCVGSLDDQHRVSIRRRCERRLDGYVSASARFRFNDDRLTEALCQRLADNARKNVG